MTKKEEFKSFVKTKPELIDYVNNGDMTWQKFYEIYDLYGDDRSVWDKYPKIISSGLNNNSLSKLTDLVKNIDIDSIQGHINTAQKALGFIQDLTTKNPTSNIVSKGPSIPRPINKFFED